MASVSKAKVAKIAAGIRAFCKKNADAALVKKYAKYFKEGYDAYGVPGDASQRERERLLELYGDELGLAGFLDLGDVLMAGGKYEEGFFAIALVAAYRDEFKKGTLPRMARWLDRGVRNWAHADVLCGDVLSYFLGERVVELDALASWRRAASKWRRRAVPVSMLALLKKEKDYRPLLEFIRPMMHDPERVVHQGLGWFLREAWKREPAPVEAFLLQFKDTAPRLIFQYATEKMTPAARNRFRRAK